MYCYIAKYGKTFNLVMYKIVYNIQEINIIYYNYRGFFFLKHVLKIIINRIIKYN